MRFLGLLALSLVLGGCNGVFYRPDRVLRLTPDKFGLSYRELTLRTSDQTRLTAWRIDPPPGRPRLGVILQFHGNAENMSTHFQYVGWLAASGYAVVTFDYRGYGASGGRPSRAGLIRDGTAALGYACHAPEFAGLDVFVVAQSLGGAAAIPAVAGFPGDCVRGLVLDSTFASYRGMARRKLSRFAVTWLLQWPLSLLLLTGDHDPIDSVAQLRMPVLLIASRYDWVVPYEESEDLYAALGPQRATLWTLERPGHIRALTPGSEYRGRLVSWLREVATSSRSASR